MFRCEGGGRDGRHVEMLKRTTSGDKGHSGSYLKLCDFTLLFMTLQVELRLNKGSLVRPRLVDQVNMRVHH